MHTELIKDKKILELNDVSYTYEGGTLPVWEHLSCCFYKGKINAICGPSGCGKSSILYLLDGLIPYMYLGKLEGQVLLEGEDITQLEPHVRCDRIGYVMQNPESQFCTFTVEEELAFGMENLGFDESLMRERIWEALEFVGMSGREKDDLTTLSGGEMQRIAIASIFVTRPEIILMDEPTANLDYESRQQVFDLIVKLSTEMNTTVILVEHNIKEIVDKLDYVIYMNHNGQVVASGTKDEVIERGWDPDPRIDYKLEDRIDLATDETVLELKNVEFAYPEPGKKRKAKNTNKQIIKGLSMDIKRQDFVAIVGESGVGKTTLARLIFRICNRDSGEINLYGKSIDSYKTKDLYNQMGFVFQNPENQFMCNTVFEEMMFSLKRVNIPIEEKEARLKSMLEKFHLDKDVEQSPFVLSQGQKRRLSVASMLLTNQKILFLDEPTYGQDFENRQELMKDMKSLVEEGITIVMITHDKALARQYATRVIEIVDGKVFKDLSAVEYFSCVGGDV